MAAPPSPWLVDPCPPEEAAALAEALGIRRTTAEVLIRRGHSTPDAARAFLEQDGPAHDPMRLGDMAAACERIERAIAAGERICVHGDYDVDGICATALAVTVLRGLGANVESHLPSRFEEGYGVAVETVERLAADGVRLLVTVDCGITAVDAVARGRELGMDVIVTDHHRPGPRRCPTAPVSARARPTTRSPSCAAPASSSSSPRRFTGGPAAILPSSSSTSTSSRSQRSPTSCRSATRTAGWCAPGCGACARRPSRACGRSWRRRASTGRARRPPMSASGSRRASTPPGGSATRTRPSSCS